ncbi:MAG: hypothetical protein JSW67_12310 [Candidatus Latescibacterota bacterium]|nr:MAG: hypothetical protein JSW67_12310 [Candidatus Latescibacterota bacterium]
MSAATRHPPCLRLYGILLLALASGCLDPESRQPTGPEAARGAKARPTVRRLADPLPFLTGLHVGALAATPTRMVATTVGPAAAKIVSIDEHGDVTPLPVQFDAFAEQTCFVAISPGLHPAFPEGDLFVSRGAELLRLRANGHAWESLVSLDASEGEIAGLCFDSVGAFGHALLILTDAGGVYALNDGNILAHVGNVGPGGRGPSVVYSLFEEFDGHFVVAFPANGDVLALSPEGSVARLTGWSGVSGAIATPQFLKTLGDGDATLFVALQGGRIDRFALDDVEPYVGGIVLTSLHGSGSGLALPHGAGIWLRAWSRHHGPEVAAAFVQRPAITRVAVDVHPAQPSIELGSTTPVPVAILSSISFAPNLVDGQNVLCAGASPVPFGKGPFGTFTDQNGDGELDLILYFRPADMQIAPGLATLRLGGSTFAGENFQGEDVIQVLAP